MLKQYTAPLSIFIVSLFLFTWGVNSQEIISFDSRFYLFALEMWRHGISWFPTTYLEPYPDYTVASTVLIYGAASLFGGLTKFTAVLPSAIAAAITVVAGNVPPTRAATSPIRAPSISSPTTSNARHCGNVSSKPVSACASARVVRPTAPTAIRSRSSASASAPKRERGPRSASSDPMREIISCCMPGG